MALRLFAHPSAWNPQYPQCFTGQGKPTDNAWIESFNDTLRDECLNVHGFDDWTDARRKLQAWQREYNEIRSHRSLNELSPLEFKARWTQQRQKFTDGMDQLNGVPARTTTLTLRVVLKVGAGHVCILRRHGVPVVAVASAEDVYQYPDGTQGSDLMTCPALSALLLADFLKFGVVAMMGRPQRRGLPLRCTSRCPRRTWRNSEPPRLLAIPIDRS